VLSHVVKLRTETRDLAAIQDASRFIEQAPGQRTEEKLTAEFYQAGQVQQATQRKN
jgi:hypothetical protein